MVGSYISNPAKPAADIEISIDECHGADPPVHADLFIRWRHGTDFPRGRIVNGNPVKDGIAAHREMPPEIDTIIGARRHVANVPVASKGRGARRLPLTG